MRYIPFAELGNKLGADYADCTDIFFYKTTAIHPIVINLICIIRVIRP